MGGLRERIFWERESLCGSPNHSTRGGLYYLVILDLMAEPNRLKFLDD